MTPRRRGAHCELTTFHSFSRGTRSRVVLLLPSYSCTSPAIIYLEIRASSPSQALISLVYHSSFVPHIYIYIYLLSTPFLFSPRTIFPAFPAPFYPLLVFLRVRNVPVCPLSTRASRERNGRGTRVRTCTGLRRVTRASQLGKCEIISAFCHVPPTCPLPTLPSFPLPSYLPSNHACSLVNPTTASTPITDARRRPFRAIHRSPLTDLSCHPLSPPFASLLLIDPPPMEHT